MVNCWQRVATSNFNHRACLQAGPILSHPVLRPLFYAAVRRWTEQPYAQTAMALPDASCSRLEALSMREADADVAAALAAEPLLADAGPPTAFVAELGPRHGNPGVTLHGGCSALLCDEAASASYCAARGVAAPPPVQRMQLSLLGAVDVKRKTSVEFVAATSESEPRAHATRRRAGRQGAAVEAEVWW
jgi:acyl-coenzyme A thioesterase PaaI-like protein